MGDEEGEVKVYAYAGERAPGESVDVSVEAHSRSVELLGARHGQGEATYANGDAYSGGFIDGERAGKGVYTYAAPASEEGEEPKPPLGTYDGAWLRGKRHGIGSLSFASGESYEGLFKEGVYEGQGTMYYANGDIYTGEWERGVKHGAGTYIFSASGTKLRGVSAARREAGVPSRRRPGVVPSRLRALSPLLSPSPLHPRLIPPPRPRPLNPQPSTPHPSPPDPPSVGVGARHPRSRRLLRPLRKLVRRSLRRRRRRAAVRVRRHIHQRERLHRRRVAATRIPLRLRTGSEELGQLL